MLEYNIESVFFDFSFHDSIIAALNFISYIWLTHSLNFVQINLALQAQQVLYNRRPL